MQDETHAEAGVNAPEAAVQRHPKTEAAIKAVAFWLVLSALSSPGRLLLELNKDASVEFEQKIKAFLGADVILQAFLIVLLARALGRFSNVARQIMVILLLFFSATLLQSWCFRSPFSGGFEQSLRCTVAGFPYRPWALLRGCGEDFGTLSEKYTATMFLISDLWSFIVLLLLVTLRAREVCSEKYELSAAKPPRFRDVVRSPFFWIPASILVGMANAGLFLQLFNYHG